MSVLKLLFDPRGTISRLDFALAAVPILLVWLFLQLIWLFVWALSFDGCTKYVPEHARLELIRGHMVLRSVGAIVVLALLLPLFATMVKRLRAAGKLSALAIILAMTAYSVAYLVGWISDYWSAYNCGDVDRTVPKL